MNTAISVESLSKRYQIGASESDRYRTLRERINGSVIAGYKRLTGLRTGAKSAARTADHWALKDVCFDVQPGEVVGIIGRNGAGKSTLLKILSRITEPTSGRATFRGRLGSLLEVGTGFHQELTGRENIFLNGSILGMSRREISRRFDEIVDFADIEGFLDTPVKRYSSGMYVRLAFAVAAHLEPEILLVDEVLAVGDAEFQKKCLGKMDRIAKGGRTVLFVSHQMSAVQRLCGQCLFLKHGTVQAYGGKDEVIAAYLGEGVGSNEPGQWIDLIHSLRSGSQQARFSQVRFRSSDSKLAGHPFPDGPLEIELRIESDVPRNVSSIAVAFYDRYGTMLVNADSVLLGRTVRLGRGTSILIQIKELHLNPGSYTLGLWLANDQCVYDCIPEAGKIEVVEAPGTAFGGRPANDGSVTCDFQVGIDI